jgi:TldD protein
MTAQRVLDVFEKAIQIMHCNGVEYADIFYQSTDGIQVVKNKTREDVLTPSSPYGVTLRVFKGGEWREASTYQLNQKEIIELAKRLPNFTPSIKKPIKMKIYDPWELDRELDVKINPNDVSIEDKMEMVRQNFAIAMNTDKRIIDAQSSYQNRTIEKIVITSEGSRLRQVLHMGLVGILAIAREGGRIEDFYSSVGYTGGFELTKGMTEQKIRKTVKEAIELLDSTQSPSGTYRLIMDPSMTGLFTHESFGHGTEADQVARGRSYLIPFIGKQMGTESINLVDQGNLTNGWGSYMFDDEGVRSQNTCIIRNGVLTNFLQDRYTASLLGRKPTGNARRESPAKKEYIRMTNTFIEPRDWTLEEMLEGFNGILVKSGSFGKEDPSGGQMQLTARKGYLIEKGKKVKVLSQIAMSGYVPNVISKIDAINGSKDFMIRAGMCGKGNEDFVFVGSGGPYIRTEVVVGPG